MRIAARTATNDLALLGSDGHVRTRSLPALVMIEPATTLRQFDIDGWLGGLGKSVEIIPWPARHGIHGGF